MRWENWRPLPFDWAPSLGSLRETLTGGQAFRWATLEDQTWQGVWSSHLVQIRLCKNDTLVWRSLQSDKNAENGLLRYFAADLDFSEIANSLPWRSDTVIAKALKDWNGLRILRQPLGEALLAFLCSSVKRIPQIAQMQEAISQNIGQKIVAGVYRLPTWSELNQANESELRGLGLGYRARYISQCAQFLAEDEDWLLNVEAMPYAQAKASLMQLPGVGEKIADCALLFGAGKLEAFPVDTWILKAMANHYELHDWSPHQVAHFGRVHFGKYAGYAQQVLFSGERS